MGGGVQSIIMRSSSAHKEVAVGCQKRGVAEGRGEKVCRGEGRRVEKRRVGGGVPDDEVALGHVEALLRDARGDQEIGGQAPA